MRRLKKVWRRTFWFIGFTAFAAVAVTLLVRFAPKPPEHKVELARIALSEATANKADTYSRILFREARALYDSAMVNWQLENKRFLYFRDYGKVENFADLCARKARQAAKVSKNNVTDLNIFLKQKIDKLNTIVKQIDERYSAYPLSAETWKNISRGKMLLKEAEVAYNKGDYSLSKTKIADSEILLTESFEFATNHLKEYFNSFPVWKKWAERTISESRQNNSYSIIIDKYSRKCLIYHAGVKKYEYHVELGKNWVGDKKVKGDKKTPEGMYRITRKFGSNKTKYHKALLIDYPNSNDLQELRNEIARGVLPKNSKPGNLIEIHGDGGRGIDWTEGCIALTNSEMDVVFRIAGEGTPVTIVGSMVNLDQLID